MKQKLIGIIILASLFIACLPFDNESKSCYRIKDGKVYLRYYGGYPRAKEVMRKLEGADAKSFEYIEGSREGACQGGDMFAKDKRQVFYRNRKVKFADPETFEAVLYGYSKDASNVFYMDSVIEKADAKSFFVIENKRKQPYAADKYGLIVRNKRIGGQVDAPSFELLSNIEHRMCFGACGVWGGLCGRLLERVRALAGSRAITEGFEGALEHPREPRGVPLGAVGVFWASLGGPLGARCGI